MDDQRQLLHDIDKRLAILETIHEQHSEIMDFRLTELQLDVKKLVAKQSNVDMKVAGLAGTVSFLMAAGISWLSR